jgi:hypothetical protein
MMKRLLLTATVLVVACPFVGMSSGDSAQSGVVVRLYPDWRDDPKAYVALTVPLEGGQVRADAVRRACSHEEVPEPGLEAILVVVPADQRDQGVIDAMQGQIFAQFLRQGFLSLRPGEVPPTQRKPYLFLDATNQPFSSTEVEVLIGQSESTSRGQTAQVWIGTVQLDADSRLQPLQSSSPLNRFTYLVVHPDCGLVPATPQYASGNEPFHVFRVNALPRDKWCVFVDALGYPMAGVQVQVVTSGSWELGKMTSLPPTALDGGGRLQPQQMFTMLARCSFVVSDPNYGTALVEPYDKTEVSPREPLSLCVVPLAVYRTPADARSIWGVVIDSDGTPIPGAVIACMRVFLVGRGEVRPYWPWPVQPNKEAKVLTNERGQFAMCLPLADGDGRLDRSIAVGMVYEVTITPPAELGCLPWRGRLAAGMGQTIVLEGTIGGSKKYEGMLAFEDERGPVTDPEKISLVNLVIRVRRPGFQPVAFGYHAGEWLEKSKLPFGMYEPTVEWDGKRYTFRPVYVTPESPEVIVFKPGRIVPFETRYRGRVVHGANGDPIPGALIVPSPGLVMEGPDPEAIRRLEQQSGGRIVRTDAAGRFEMVLPIVAQPGPEHTLTAIKEDYLLFEQQRAFFTPAADGGRPGSVEFPTDSRGRVLLPEMKLFPAGALTIEPNVPGEHRGRRVRLDFLTASGNSASWLKDLWAPAHRSSGGHVIHPKELAVGMRQTVYIPAYVTLTLRLQLPDDRYAPAFVEDVLVGQGRSIDLGRIDFVRTMPVTVKVMDSQDNPLEGITVTCRVGRGNHAVGEAVTNTDGLARLHVAMHSAGRFTVEYDDPRTRAPLREEIPYEVGGRQGTGREFILQLSDEFLEHASKSH